MARLVDPRQHTPDLPAVLAPDKTTGYATPLTAEPAPGPTTAGAGVTPTPTRPAPMRPAGWRNRLPAKGTVDYVRDAITTIILILALPYIVRKLFTDPGSLFAQAGRAKVGK